MNRRLGANCPRPTAEVIASPVGGPRSARNPTHGGICYCDRAHESSRTNSAAPRRTADILTALQITTNHYELPPDACISFRALYEQLSALEADLHRHIHLENNILFPRAAALESGVRDDVACVY